MIPKTVEITNTSAMCGSFVISHQIKLHPDGALVADVATVMNAIVNRKENQINNERRKVQTYINKCVPKVVKYPNRRKEHSHRTICDYIYPHSC